MPTNTAKHGLRIPIGTDPADQQTDWAHFTTDLEAIMSVYSQGATLASRPSAGKAGRRYFDQTSRSESVDDGSVWTPVLPPGLIMPYAGGTAPPGYLICDGSAVSRTTYATLFAAIGTAYGAGNGTTTFNLPDLQGRVPVGKAPTTPTGHADVDALGDNDGVALASRRPKHSHTVDAHAHTITHTHTYSGTTGIDGQMGISFVGQYLWQVPQNSANHTHGYSGTTSGSSAANSGNASPGTDVQGPSYQVVNFLIKI